MTTSNNRRFFQVAFDYFLFLKTLQYELKTMDYFLKRIAGIAVLVLSLRSSYAQTAGTAATNVPVTATGAPTEAGWGGCVDPNNPSAKLELGKLTTICITLSSSSEWNIPPPSARTLRLSFQPEADEYSRFHVPSSYKDLIQDRATNVHDGFGNVTIHASSQNVLSYQRMFYETNGGAGRIYPYLTAIIDVREGDVKGITWDDACLFCSDDKCVENTYDFDGNLGTREEFQQPVRISCDGSRNCLGE